MEQKRRPDSPAAIAPHLRGFTFPAPFSRAENGVCTFFAVIASQCAEVAWQAPGPMEPGNDYYQKSRRTSPFLVLFGTFPH